MGEKEDFKVILLRIFDFKIFEEEEVGGVPQ